MHIRLIASVVSLASLWACQGPEKAEELQVQAQTQAPRAVDTEESAHSTEAMIGPDEAFFANVYLEEVFRYSYQNSEPNVKESAQFSLTSKPESAFDYIANFSDARLELMARGLLASGDSDQDRQLSEEEFTALRLDPAVYGAQGESIAHRFSPKVFQELAGDDAWVDAAELQSGLRTLIGLLKPAVDSQNPHEHRLTLVRAWKKVVARYDTDRDGDLSLSEQRQLRSERAQLVRELPEI